MAGPDMYQRGNVGLVRLLGSWKRTSIVFDMVVVSLQMHLCSSVAVLGRLVGIKGLVSLVVSVTFCCAFSLCLAQSPLVSAGQRGFLGFWGFLAS